MTTLATAGRQLHARAHEGGRVVVGVDDSPGGLAALRWAVRLARSRGAQLMAVRVDCATLEIGPTIASDFDAVWQMHRAMPPPHRRQIAGRQQVPRNRGQFPPSRPPSKCSTSRSATWRSSAPQHRDPQLGAETGAPGVHHLLRRAKSQPHETAAITYSGNRTLPAHVPRRTGCSDRVREGQQGPAERSVTGQAQRPCFLGPQAAGHARGGG
jgi:hypothetical protein